MSTKDRDLSPVTDTLWKSFYEKEFRIECTNSVSEIMKEWNLKFKWSELYREKSKRVKKDEKKEDDRKLSRQINSPERPSRLQAFKHSTNNPHGHTASTFKLSNQIISIPVVKKQRTEKDAAKKQRTESETQREN
ncbi:uncharacterized protein LOC112165089 [Rosa chinensis]|uniref:uncharacterized protein LOC112165089 n=1 Tax=Rosa chinensis TaxID=74649 RepID=UPI000D087CFE|nr:uncharacterized protein LOC112165089 [Rosa chinensis]